LHNRNNGFDYHAHLLCERSGESRKSDRLRARAEAVDGFVRLKADSQSV